jgi:transposase
LPATGGPGESHDAFDVVGLREHVADVEAVDSVRPGGDQDAEVAAQRSARAWAPRSCIPSFVELAATVRLNRYGTLAAVELGLSNSRLAGLNSNIRLVNHPG